jgi:hypothetical protein
MSKVSTTSDQYANKFTKPVSQVNGAETDTFESVSAELDAALREGKELELQGKLDTIATRRLEARLQLISDRLENSKVAQAPTINAEQLASSHKSIWTKITIGLFLLAFIGIVLEFTIGRNFVFAYTNAYQAVIPILFAMFTPLFAVVFFLHERKNNTLAQRYPTWLVRWLLMFPITVMTASAILIFSPFGWSALAGFAIGNASPPKVAKVLSVEPMREPKKLGRCNQRAK